MRRHLAWVVALTVGQLAMGLCLGCYYNYTFFGRAAGPLPQPVAATGAVLYYLLVASGDAQTVQAWLWMLCFPVAGWVWVGVLWLVGWRVVGSTRGLVSGSLLGLAPVCLPLPYLVWRHALTPHGPTWQQFVEAALYRRFDTVPAGLTPLFVVLAAAGLVIEVGWLARAARCSLPRALAWFVLSLGLSMVVLAVLSAPFVARN